MHIWGGRDGEYVKSVAQHGWKVDQSTIGNGEGIPSIADLTVHFHDISYPTEITLSYKRKMSKIVYAPRR